VQDVYTLFEGNFAGKKLGFRGNSGHALSGGLLFWLLFTYASGLVFWENFVGDCSPVFTLERYLQTGYIVICTITVIM